MRRLEAYILGTLFFFKGIRKKKFTLSQVILETNKKHLNDYEATGK